MASREDLLRRAIWLSAISIAFSGIVGGIAVVVAFSTHQLSLVGFGIDAVIDSVASIALVWRFHDERRNPHSAELVERAAEVIVGGALLALQRIWPTARPRRF